MTKKLTLERLAQLCFVVFGVAIGSRAIQDNSTLLHLRTGISIVTEWSVPSSDPYSFSAAGHSWVVQSWLAELIYGLCWKIDHSLRMLVMLQMLLLGSIFAVVARLIKTGSFRRTALSGVIVFAVFGPWISPRPLLFGFLCFALFLLVIVERRAPWLLIPIFWVWANSHGSWPLGLLWFGAYAVGQVLDRKSAETSLGGALRDTFHYLRPFGLFALLGLLSSVVSPLGYRTLTFPLVALQRRDTFKDIAEWGSPDWRGSALWTLAGLVALVLVLRGRRAPLALLLPVLGFFGLGMISLRNMPFLGLAIAPLITAAWAQRPNETSAASATQESVLTNRVVAALLGIVGIATVFSGWTKDGVDQSPYPVEPFAYLEARGLVGGQKRVFGEDWVGCWMILRFGNNANVFIDDRYDMYPDAVVKDYVSMRSGSVRSRDLFDSYGFESMVIENESRLATLVRLWPEWQEVPASEWQTQERLLEPPSEAESVEGSQRWALFTRTEA